MKRAFFITGALLMVSSASLFATPANKKAFEKFFGPTLSENLKSCAVCHVRADANGAESLEDFPHNPFGKKIAALDGKISDRLETVLQPGEALDKILTGQFPAMTQQGQVTDSTLLNQKRAEFAEFRSRYPWTPYETVKRPDLPGDDGENTWAKNGIDYFIAAEHRRHGLTPRPVAAPEVWLRRVTIDLTGLTPTAAEIQSFRQNPDYEKKVDELLASARYGERWGRHFMDVWRYADWTGYKDALRESARHIWNWRDWIIESLNEDKGYDQMILEMLAGDELWPLDRSKLRATGYLARNFHRDRSQWMDDIVTHTSQAFLGVTLGCSKCHDHMYDPFPQTDYFAMRAIFEPYQVRTDRVPGQLDTMKDGLPRAYDANLTAVTLLLDRGDERFPLKDRPIAPGVPSALGGDWKIEPVSLPALAAEPWKRDFVKDELMAVKTTALKKAEATLAALSADTDPKARKEAELQLAAMQLQKAALESEFAVEAVAESDKRWKALAEATFDAQRQAQLAEAQWKAFAGDHALELANADLAAAKTKKDADAIATATKTLTTAKKNQAEAKKLLTAAEKQIAAKLSTKFVARDQNYPDRSTGRRTAFARWLTDKKNPLTARVIANHIWMRHFQFGLVPTVNEFGANGREPTHPALLDWLAAELMEGDWSLKSLHKTIVLSATYRMESTPESANLTIDPDNQYLWRMPTRRMEGEIVRDNLLWVGGRLDPQMGGPDIPNDEAQTSMRRSIYLRHAHEKLVEFVQIFDGPKVSECYSREESIQPHQALAMHNSLLTQKAASNLAKELGTSGNGDPEAIITEGFLRLLGRDPRREEIELCREFLSKSGTDPQRSRERLMTVLLNHHEFVTVR